MTNGTTPRTEALKRGMEAKSKEFVEKDAEVYAKAYFAGVSPATKN